MFLAVYNILGYSITFQSLLVAKDQYTQLNTLGAPLSPPFPPPLSSSLTEGLAGLGGKVCSSMHLPACPEVMAPQGYEE